jgi:hypothetical protein
MVPLEPFGPPTKVEAQVIFTKPNDLFLALKRRGRTGREAGNSKF